MFASIVVSVGLLFSSVIPHGWDEKQVLAERRYSRPPASAKCPEWWFLASQVGWPRRHMPMLDKIIYRESRCDYLAWNPADPMGGSFGLTQVNGSWLRWLRDRGVIEFREDLSDPEANLLAALLIYRYAHNRYGMGWNPWGFRVKT